MSWVDKLSSVLKQLFTVRFLVCGVWLLCFWICTYPFGNSDEFDIKIDSRQLSTAATNETLCHSTAHASGSLFGGLATLDPIISTLSFLIIVGAVLFVEQAFHHLNLITDDTPFQKLVPTVEKELMIAGCTAFLFKIIVNSSENINLSWFHSLEYADLVVPVFSLIYCILGLVLIAASVRHCDMWSRAFHRLLVDLLDEFYECADKAYYWLLPAPFNQAIGKLEFMIFFHIFCDENKIQRRAFAFNEYVEKVNEKFVMEIIEIRPFDWILVSLIYMCNLLRLARHQLNNCEDTDISCINRHFTLGFTVAGFFLLFCTFMVAILSRSLELRIMSMKGISGCAMYHSFLQYMENRQDSNEDKEHMNIDQLKMAAEQSKSYLHGRQARNMKAKLLLERLSHRIPKFISGSMKSRSARGASGEMIDLINAHHSKRYQPSVNQTPATFMGGQVENEDFEIERSTDVSEMNFINGKGTSGLKLYTSSYDAVDECDEENIVEDFEQSMKLGNDAFENKSRIHSTAVTDNVDSVPSSTDQFFRVGSEKVLPKKVQSLLGIPLSIKSSIFKSSAKSNISETPDPYIYDPQMDKFKSCEISSVFWNGNPAFYFECVQALIMLISIYCAMWLTNFAVAAEKPGLIIVSLLPGLLSGVLYVYIVKTATCLKAIYTVDNDAVLEVIEDSESSNILSETIRGKLVKRLQEIGEPQAELFNLFNEIDIKGNGWLIKEELAVFMNAVGVHFSRKKWLQIFRKIDIDSNDKVTFEEFFLFLFPDHHVGLTLEKQRLAIVRERIKEKASHYRVRKITFQSILYSIWTGTASSKSSKVVPTDKERRTYRKRRSMHMRAESM